MRFCIKVLFLSFFVLYGVVLYGVVHSLPTCFAEELDNVVTKTFLPRAGEPITIITIEKKPKPESTELSKMAKKLDEQRIQLQKQINDDYVANKISAKQLFNLQKQLNAIADMSNKYQEDLDTAKVQKITSRLNILEAALKNDIAAANKTSKGL